MATFPSPASASASASAAAPGAIPIPTPSDQRQRSLFELPPDFFDSCHLLPSPDSPAVSLLAYQLDAVATVSFPQNPAENDDGNHVTAIKTEASLFRWTCNTCKIEFESLQDQRSHFKSDIHRINVKLSIAGKEIVKEDDFNEGTLDSFQDDDISSISGSEDEDDRVSAAHSDAYKRTLEAFKQKFFVQLQNGERVSIWKSLVHTVSEDVLLFDENTTNGVIKRLQGIIREPRDGTCLRVLLLASGGHFAACVFDGNTVVAHKTFHRYVVRAKAGKKQSLKDASGRFAHSAGASLRRYNELSLKKDIQDLLARWKTYFEASSCVFIHAPSNNRQLLFEGEKPCFSHSNCLVRNVPVNVRRPTLKEAKRIYSQLTQLNYEVYEEEISTITRDESLQSSCKDEVVGMLVPEKNIEISSSVKHIENVISSESDNNAPLGFPTALHEASRLGDAGRVLELLEQGLDPCAKDERGRTPYMLANEKEVRNTFRRFMASNLERWDWHTAKVPSALTKEMEESQVVKQAEKDAKKKARAKELKKLRKAKEKKAQAEAAISESVASSVGGTSLSAKGQPPSNRTTPQMSKEEALRAAQAAEREKRAAAAERRMAAALSSSASDANGSSSSQPRPAPSDGANCSFCSDSLAGKVPFHRYNYKYCSTTCMHLHREALEDE